MKTQLFFICLLVFSVCTIPGAYTKANKTVIINLASSSKGDKDLFAAKGQNCPADVIGVVTGNPNHRGCSSSFIGSLVDSKATNARVKLYQGTEPNVNAGIISPDPNYRNGSTEYFGSTVTQEGKTSESVRLYEVVDCPTKKLIDLHVGTVTIDKDFQTCSTRPIGWTVGDE